MPANTPAPAPALGQGPQIGQILLLLLYLALIFAGAYFVTRIFARIAQRGVLPAAKAGARHRHIFLVDRLALDRERSVLLLEADGKRYLVGVSGQAFTLLEKTDAPPEPMEPAAQGRPSFREAFAAFTKQGDDQHAS